MFALVRLVLTQVCHANALLCNGGVSEFFFCRPPSALEIDGTILITLVCNREPSLDSDAVTQSRQLEEALANQTA